MFMQGLSTTREPWRKSLFWFCNYLKYILHEPQHILQVREIEMFFQCDIAAQIEQLLILLPARRWEGRFKKIKRHTSAKCTRSW